MDITGLGESLIARLIEIGMIKTLEDIFRLDFDQIAGLNRLGTKSAANLKQSIQIAKAQKFDRVLYALGIRFVGTKTARILTEHFNNIDKLMQSDIEILTSIPEIGDKIAQSVYNYFRIPENIALIGFLKQAGLQFVSEASGKVTVLLGKTFLITGTLINYDRKEMEELILSNGGKLLSSVSNNLDYLVVGENPGSKLDKARRLGTVNIISEDEILDMLGK
jgi:DNA ligase (NAD+)